MIEWEFSKLKLKLYPHFDAKLTKKQILNLVENPLNVAQHSFFPFLYFEEKFTRFRPTNGTIKTRPIRYAGRADSYIFSRYRHILSSLYEKQLIEKEVSECVLAYRRIPKKAGVSSGKCNIDFAKEIFDIINDLGDCIVVTADISKYFDHIDHKILKDRWETLLNVERLPDDHFRVYERLTKFADVDYKRLCIELGYFGEKETAWGKREGFLVPKKEIPTKICSNKKFQEIVKKSKVVGNSIIRTNKNKFGIPQGAPLSDVLANAYLIDFDIKCKEFSTHKNGHYFRYSDDIIFIIPTNDEKLAETTEKFVRSEICKTGPKIKIQQKKCASLIYTRSGNKQKYKALSLKPDKKSLNMANGLEYLGFRYDGKLVYLRDKTVSNFYRKVKRNAWAESYSLVSRYPDKKPKELIENYNFEDFYKRFGKVECFEDITLKNGQANFKSWTFHTYAKRASKTFGKQGTPILKQVRNFRVKAKTNITSKIIKAYSTKTKAKRRK